MGGWFGQPQVTRQSLLAWLFSSLGLDDRVPFNDALASLELLALRLGGTEVPRL